MDRVLETIEKLIKKRLGNDYNLPADFPLWIKDLKRLAKEKDGQVTKTYYVALLVQVLSRGDTELMTMVARSSVPDNLMKYLTEKIPRNKDTAKDDSQAELRKKSIFQSLLITRKHAQKRIIFKKRFLIKLMIEQDGVRWLLDLPITDETVSELANFLEEISNIKEILRYICTIQRNVDKVVKLALEILDQQKEFSREKHHLVMFLLNSFIYRPVLSAFDRQKGLPKLLQGLLKDDGRAVSEGTSGMLLSKSEMETVLCTCRALECYFKAQLVMKLDSISNNCYEPLDISEDAMDSIRHQIQKHHKNGSGFDVNEWPVVEEFLSEGGPEIMVRLCQVTKSSILDGIVQCAFYVLYIVSLVPSGCTKIVDPLSTRYIGEIIIKAADPDRNLLQEEEEECSPYLYPENAVPALKLLENIFLACEYGENPTSASAAPLTSASAAPSTSASAAPSTSASAAPLTPASAARRVTESFINGKGLEFLRGYLQPREYFDSNFEKIWTLSCQLLLILTKDVKIADDLKKLKILERLEKLTNDHPADEGDDAEWVKDRQKVTTELIKVLADPVHTAIPRNSSSIEEL